MGDGVMWGLLSIKIRARATSQTLMCVCDARSSTGPAAFAKPSFFFFSRSFHVPTRDIYHGRLRKKMDGKAPLVKVGSNGCRIFTNFFCHYNSFPEANLNGNWKKTQLLDVPSHHGMSSFPLSVDPSTLTLFSEQTLFRNDSWLSIRTTQTQHDGPCLFLFCNICAVLLCVRVCVCVCVTSHFYTYMCSCEKSCACKNRGSSSQSWQQYDRVDWKLLCVLQLHAFHASGNARAKWHLSQTRRTAHRFSLFFPTIPNPNPQTIHVDPSSCSW
jgi:hypothetical protein